MTRTRHQTFKRALETVGTIAVVATAVYAAVVLTRLPVAPPMTVRNRSDWWRAMVTHAGRE